MNPATFKAELYTRFDGERIVVNVLDRRIPLIGTISSTGRGSENFLYLSTVEFGLVLIPLWHITDVCLLTP